MSRAARDNRGSHDITNLTILIEPGELPKSDMYRDVDPVRVAEFDDARKGPITGVPTR
jgi:hypothetical protein